MPESGGAPISESRGLQRRPILVTGAHRSGTTWVGRMLALSNEVGYIHEPFGKGNKLGISPRLIREWYPYLPASPHAEEVREALQHLLAFEFPLGRALLSLRRPRDLLPVLETAGEFYAARRRRARPLLKDPMALLSAEWFAEQSDAEVVVMIRHPAGFVSSVCQLNWTYPFDEFARSDELMRSWFRPFAAEIERYAADPPPLIDQAILLWRILYSVVASYVESHPEWTFLRHEDISRGPAAEFAALYQRFGLSFTPNVARRLEIYTSAANPIDPPRLAN